MAASRRGYCCPARVPVPMFNKCLTKTHFPWFGWIRSLSVAHPWPCHGQSYGWRRRKLAVDRQRAFSLLVIRVGFEPKTHSLEGCCSIQLSYRTILMFRLEGCPFAKNRSANIGIFYLMAMFPGESFCKFYMPDTQESETGGVREM